MSMMTVTIMKKKPKKTRVGIFENMGGNIPGGNFLGGNFPGGNFLEGSLMGGNFQVGVLLIPLQDFHVYSSVFLTLYFTMS